MAMIAADTRHGARKQVDRDSADRCYLAASLTHVTGRNGIMRCPMPKRASLFVVLFALTACGGGGASQTGGGGGGQGGNGSTGTGGAGTSTSTGTGTSTGGAGGGESFSVTFDPVMINPGEENTKCVIKKLTNPTALHVGKIHNVLGQGSHHLIVYKTNDTMEQTTPFDCQPFADLLTPDKGSPLMITQKKDDLLELPPGVAFAIGAEQFVRLEMHYINTTSAPLEVTATTTLISMDEKDFKDEADFLFFGTPDIDIAPQSAATVGPIYIPLPSMLEGSKFFGFTGHEHHWGTGVTVGVTTGKTGADTMIYDPPSFSWSEPPTVYQDPPVTVPQGGGFHLTCKWQNNGTSSVKFGESANDEMCFFWTYYYPSKGAFVCAHTDKYVPGGFDLCCPGNALCSQVFN
jgi:hypothetical protein